MQQHISQIFAFYLGHHDTDECWLGPSTCIDQEVNTLRMTFDSGMGPAGWMDLLPSFYEDNAGSGLPRWPLRRIKPVSQNTISLLCCLPPPPSDNPRWPVFTPAEVRLLLQGVLSERAVDFTGESSRLSPAWMECAHLLILLEGFVSMWCS